MTDTSDLERTAAAGDPEAQHALAAQLFQEITPEGFDHAVSLTESAAAAGHGDALAQLATIEAAGAGRPQNFERALDLLVQAARSGSDHARAQLKLLSGGDGEDWAELRRGIDVGQWLQVPEKQSLADEPRIRTMEGFANAAVCDWAINRSRDKLDRATVWDELAGSGKVHPGRSNRSVELRLTEMDVVLSLLRAKIAVATRLPEPLFETPQVMHYAVGEEYRHHHDYLDPSQPGHAKDMAQRGQRIATFIIYLSDDFEGGETDFPKAGIRYRGRKGDAIFFANVTPDGQGDPLTVHAGLPPTKGEKWIFSQWIRDRSPGATA